MQENQIAKILIENGADLCYFGNQKTNPFCFIHNNKIKVLCNLTKQYFPSKKYKDLIIKCKNNNEKFQDFKFEADTKEGKENTKI